MDIAALPPIQSCSFCLIGMLLVSPQGCWPDPRFQKGCPAPTPNPPNPGLYRCQVHQELIETKHWAWAQAAEPQRRGQERGMPWEARDGAH